MPSVGRAPPASTGSATLPGLDHDHAVLADRLALAREPNPGLDAAPLPDRHERRCMEKEAFRLGKKLYRRKPKKQARRLRIRQRVRQAIKST